MHTRAPRVCQDHGQRRSVAVDGRKKVVDVLVLCAIPVEWHALKSLISNPSEDSVLTDPCLVGTMPIQGNDVSIALVETGMGTTAASLATLAAITQLSPALVIYAGIAGGVKDARIGDVTIASKVYYYEPGKSVDGQFLPRPEAYSTPHRLVAIARAISHQDRPDFRVLVGAIASGEKVIADAQSAQAQLLRESYSDTLSVEMEGAGFMTACSRTGTGAYVLVRGISDLLDGKGESDAGGGQERASTNLAIVTREVVLRFFDDLAKPAQSPSNVEHQIGWHELGIPRPTQNESYILIAPTGSAASRAIAASRLPLSLVLDLDPNTDRNGLLFHSREHHEIHRPVHLLTTVDPLVSSKNAITWVAVRGLDVADDFREWKRSGRRRLRGLLEEFSKMAGGRHTNLLVATDVNTESEWVAALIDDLLSEFAEASHVVAFGPQMRDLEVDGRVDIEAQELAAGLAHVLTQASAPSSPLIPCKEDPHYLGIDAERASWLEEDLDIVDSRPPSGDLTAAALDFLRGGRPTWAALESNVDAIRTMYRPWRKTLEGVLKNRRTLRINLFHEPGAGGSTVARRAAFDLRTDYPSVLLRRFRVQETSRRIDYLARATDLPVFVVVDTASVTDAQIADLMEELHASSTSALVLYVSRRYTPLPPESKAAYLREALDDAEADDFYETLRGYAPWNFAQLEAVRNNRDYRRNAFFFGLSAFEDDFVGIDDYVSARLADTTESQISVAKFCALAHYYGQTEIPEYALAQLVGLPPGRASALPRVLTAELRQLMWRSPEGGWRTTHPLVAQHVLRHLGGGDRWKQMLSTWGRQLADFCLDRVPGDNELGRIVEAVFIEREGLLGSATGARASFARILDDIPSPNGAGELLGHISSLAAEEGHFAAHAARFFAFRIGDFETAQRFGEQARALDPQDHVLQHVVGMVHRARVNDGIGRRVQLDELVPWVTAASTAFEASRRCSPSSNEHPYISEVQMRLAVVDYGVRRSGSIAAYLAGTPHTLVVESISVAEDLLARVRYLGDARNPSGYEERARGQLTSLYGDYDRALQLFNSLLGKRDVDPLPVRRQIVWTHLARAKRDWRSLSPKSRERVLSLLEENMVEGGYRSTDVRQWWRAIRYASKPPSQDRVHEILTYWREGELGPEPVYASYVAYAVDLLDGLKAGRDEFERFKSECSARSRGDGKRSLCLDWIGPGEGVGKLVHQSELGPWDPRVEFWSDRSPLRRMEGRVHSIKGPQAGTVICDGIEAFFVPSRAGIEKGRDENARLSGYLAFSNDGPRFWDAERMDKTRN